MVRASLRRASLARASLGRASFGFRVRLWACEFGRASSVSCQFGACQFGACEFGRASLGVRVWAVRGGMVNGVRVFDRGSRSTLKMFERVSPFASTVPVGLPSPPLHPPRNPGPHAPQERCQDRLYPPNPHASGGIKNQDRRRLSKPSPGKMVAAPRSNNKRPQIKRLPPGMCSRHSKTRVKKKPRPSSVRDP